MTSISGGSFGSPYANRADNYANQFTRGANGMLETHTTLARDASTVDTFTINQGLVLPGYGGNPVPEQDRIGRLERAVDQLSQQGPRKNDGKMDLQELMMLKELMKDDKKDKPNFLEKVLDPAGIFTGKKSGGGLLGGLFG